MKLRPLHDKVLVKRTEEEETSSGGIILSGSAKEKPSQGEVISAGPGKKNDSGEVVQPAVPHFLKQIDKEGRANRLDLANWLCSDAKCWRHRK